MRPKLFGVALAALLGAGFALAADSAHSEGPQTAFFRGNALYGQGDYAGAVREYERVLDSGLHSGSVYFNLGNAYFKLGEMGKAILNYARARRFLPSDPDVRANLAYALSQTGAESCRLPGWQRLLFPLAERVSAANMFVAAILLYSGLFLTLAGARLLSARPRWLHWTAAVLGLCLLVTTASLVRRLIANDWQRVAVVFEAGENPVRFEPSKAGTVHFVLKEGAQVRVLEERGRWRQVARCDGRRGWIDVEAVEELFPTPDRETPDV